MPYAVKHYASLDMAEVVLSGEITGADLRAATSEAIQLQRRTGVVRFLVNSERWEFIASDADIEEVLEKQYRAEGLARPTRIAILLPGTASARKAAAYYEEACRKRGWNAQICADRYLAMDWLMSTERAGAA